MNDPDSKVSQMADKELGDHGRGYHLMPQYGTTPNVVYLKKVDENAKESDGGHA